MGRITSILQTARQRAKEMSMAIEGVLLPAEAYKILHSAPGAILVDVCCRAELDWVGKVPNSVGIEWATYPGMIPNPQFIV